MSPVVQPTRPVRPARSQRVRLRRIIWGLLVSLAILATAAVIQTALQPAQTPVDASPALTTLEGLTNTVANNNEWSLLLLVLVILLVIFWFISRLGGSLMQRSSFSGSYESIKVAANSEQLIPGPLPRDIARRMRLREVRDTQDIDVAATIESLTRTPGSAKLVFQTVSRIPEYLVLLDRSSSEDFRAHRVLGILSRLSQDGVAVVTYLFDNDPRALVSKQNGSSISLADLQEKYPDHRLVICSEAGGFVSPVTGKAYPWLNQLRGWRDRFILTLVPVVDWGHRERVLCSSGFGVLPSSADGFAGTADSRFAYRLIRDGLWEDVPLFPESLREDQDLWLDSNAPMQDVVQEGLQQSRDFLGDDGYRWLAASAVFPSVSWNLTARLGNVITSGNRERLLLRIARLPWFQFGFMPDWLRQELLDDLDGREEKEIRAQIRKMLVPRSDTKAGVIQFHKARFLNAFRFKARQDSVETDSRNRLFLSWTDNRLGFRLPRMLMRFIRRRGGGRDQRDSSNLVPGSAHHFSPTNGFSFKGLLISLGFIVLALLLGALNGWIGLFSLFTVPYFGKIASFFVFLVVVFICAVLCLIMVDTAKIRGAVPGSTAGFFFMTAFLYMTWATWLAGSNELKESFSLDVSVWIPLAEQLAGDSFWWAIANWCFWGIYTISFYAAGIAIAIEFATKPFCSKCNEWTSSEQRIFGPIINQARVLEQVTNGVLNGILSLRYASTDDRAATLVEVESCAENCHAVTLLSITSRKSKVSRLGHFTSQVDEQVEHWLFVPMSSAATLVDWIKQSTSVRANPTSVKDPAMRAVVDAVLPYGDEKQFNVIGEISRSSAMEARQENQIPVNAPIAAIVERTGFIFVIPVDKPFITLTDTGIFWADENILYQDMIGLTITTTDEDSLQIGEKLLEFNDSQFSAKQMANILNRIIADPRINGAI